MSTQPSTGLQAGTSQTCCLVSGRCANAPHSTESSLGIPVEARADQGPPCWEKRPDLQSHVSRAPSGGFLTFPCSTFLGTFLTYVHI